MREDAAGARANATPGQAGTTDQQSDDFFLPPRKAVHPSEKKLWSRLYYGVLLSLFVLLIVAAIGWFYWREGYRFSF